MTNQMHTRIHFGIALALTVLSFAAGYWARDVVGPTKAQMEDQALVGILENVGYASLLAKGDLSELRNMIDINLNGHIARVVELQGTVKDERFEASKIRTLNAVARLWDERPPFEAVSDSTAEAKDSHWYPEWREMTAQNMKLLAWAKALCATTPELECATGPIGK